MHFVRSVVNSFLDFGGSPSAHNAVLTESATKTHFKKLTTDKVMYKLKVRESL